LIVPVADTLDALADADLLAVQRHALDVADESPALARLSYAAGKSNVLQLIESERLDQQVRLGCARAETQRHQDTTQLFVAMGGGWWGTRFGPQTAAEADVRNGRRSD
jgi:outer membrane protein TolC